MYGIQTSLWVAFKSACLSYIYRYSYTHTLEKGIKSVSAVTLSSAVFTDHQTAMSCCGNGGGCGSVSGNGGGCGSVSGNGGGCGSVSGSSSAGAGGLLGWLSTSLLSWICRHSGAALSALDAWQS